MPGNAGGAKGPDFWCAFEDGEVVVIGNEPANTIIDRRRRRSLCRGAKETVPKARAVSLSGMGNGALAIGPKLPRPPSTLPFRPWRSPQRAIAIGAAAPAFRRAAALRPFASG